MKQKIRFRMRWSNSDDPYEASMVICPEEFQSSSFRCGAIRTWLIASGLKHWPIVGRRVS